MRPLLWPSKSCRSSNETPAARRRRPNVCFRSWTRTRRKPSGAPSPPACSCHLSAARSLAAFHRCCSSSLSGFCPCRGTWGVAETDESRGEGGRSGGIGGFAAHAVILKRGGGCASRLSERPRESRRARLGLDAPGAAKRVRSYAAVPGMWRLPFRRRGRRVSAASVMVGSGPMAY
jgi:hypothetical protein